MKDNSINDRPSCTDMPDEHKDRVALAREHFEKGRKLWQDGKRGEAMTEYNIAISLDPDSPAATALEMANRIMDFYDKDRYNP